MQDGFIIQVVNRDYTLSGRQSIVDYQSMCILSYLSGCMWGVIMFKYKVLHKDNNISEEKLFL